MSEDKRKNARTQGRYSGGDGEFDSRRRDKQKNSKMSPVEKNKGEKRKAPVVGSRAQNEIDIQYEEKSKYSFKELEPVRKPKEIRFDEPILILSETENGISRLLYDPDFMQISEADEYFTILQHATKWHDKNIVIRGEEYPQPRLVAWYGPHPYTYAGATLEAREMPDTIQKIKEKAEATLRHYGIEVELNSVLLNLYRNEKDSVAWHSDDELTLGVCPTIVSVSLGETRKFEMRPKENIKEFDTNDISYVNLTHGSLIVMDGCMQADWLHRVPKEFHDKGPRINLTFRTIFPMDELPPVIPRRSKMRSSKSPNAKPVPQQDPKFDEEHFPPLGAEVSDKKTKLLPKENNKDYKQRKFLKEETWDDDMLQGDECSDETPKFQNNLNKKSSHDSVMDSPELHSSQTDFNSNVKDSPKMCNTESSDGDFMKSEYQSDNLETFQSYNYNSDETFELESKDPNPSESEPVKIEAEPVDIVKNADSGKKYMLNADAPDFVPQNKFERYSLSELAEYTRRLKNEELNSFSKVIFKSLKKGKLSLFIQRDLYELDVYEKLNDGSLSDEHLKIILERIGSMITNAIYKKNDPRYRHPSRSYDENNYGKHRQSYGRSQRH